MDEVSNDQSDERTSAAVVPVSESESKAAGSDGDGAEVTVARSNDTSTGSKVLGSSTGAKVISSTWKDPLRGTGVAQIRYEFRCKVCQLSSKAPEIYKSLHELIFAHNMSWTSAMGEANLMIRQAGYHISPINIVNMSGHFNRHIKIESPVIAAIAHIGGADGHNTSAPAAVAEVASIIEASPAAMSDIDDYKNLDTLRQRITHQLEKLGQQLDVIDPKTNTKKLDKWALDLYVKVSKEVRASINDLNDMRKSERLMNNVVQTLLDRLTFAIIPQLLSEYSTIVEELYHAKVPPEIVMRIDDRLRRKTAEIIATTARSAVTEVQRQFKLK